MNGIKKNLGYIKSSFFKNLKSVFGKIYEKTENFDVIKPCIALTFHFKCFVYIKAIYLELMFTILKQ